MTSQKLTTILIFFIGLFFAAFSVWFAFTRGAYQVLGLAVAVPIVIFFMNKPQLLYMLCLSLFFSGIRIPGVFADFNLYHFCSILLIGLGAMDWLIRKERPKVHGPTSLLVIFFLGNLVILMAARGTGFRAFGDTNWGGMRYVFIAISALLYLNSTFVELNDKQWRWTVFLMCALGALPFLAEAVFALSRGTIFWQYNFFQFAGGTALHFESMIGEGEGVGRFQMARLAGESLVLLTLAFWYSPKMRLVLKLSLILFGFALISISGHRIGIIRTGAFLWIYFFLRMKKRRAFLYTASGVILVSLLAFVYLTAPILPTTAQRAIAFLPGIDIDFVAEQSANSTSQWRLNVWREALQEIPDYWLLGKGYTFPANIRELLLVSGRREFIAFWAIETVAYHNGILSLLIGMGVSGLILGSSLLVILLVRPYRIATQGWKQKDLHSIFIAIFSVNAVNILLFFTLYGDVQVTFPRVLFLAMILEGLALRKRTTENNIPNKEQSVESGNSPQRTPVT